MTHNNSNGANNLSLFFFKVEMEVFRFFRCTLLGAACS